MDRHKESVYRFLVALRTGSDDAEDALQECFVSAWRSAGTYQSSSSARGWLCSIARNALKRQHRRRAGEPIVMDPLEKLGERAGWGVTSDFSARFEAGNELECAMGQRSREKREVVVLRDLEGLTGEEAALALGLSLAAMNSQWHRGRLRLMGLIRTGGGG